MLQIEPGTPLEEVKKKYRRYSILVHPDKNQDDAERAQQAFEIINKAWKTLENDDTRKKCMDIYDEAKGRTDLMVKITLFSLIRLILSENLFCFFYISWNLLFQYCVRCSVRENY